MELTAYFSAHPKAAIAFSGGVDSAYLLYAAVQCGAEVRAYYVKTPFQPQFEYEDAQKLSRQLGIEMVTLPVDVLCREEIVSNPANRCYFCKRALFSRILEAAAEDGFSLILDGTNASDDDADRPGIQALRELQVQSPLRLCGLTKEEIRRRAREAGLFTWNKPAYACLATRIPTGEEITREKLEKTEQAEQYLMNLGFRDFRVRLDGGRAKLQLSASDLPLVMEHREEIVHTLRKSYDGVLLDLEVRHAF